MNLRIITHRLRKVLPCFVVLLIVLTGCEPLTLKKTKKQKKPKVTSAAFNFSVPAALSPQTTIELKQYADKVVLLDFWATWDLPCQAELPVMNQLADDYADQGLVVLGLIMDKGNDEQMRDFLTKNPAPFSNGLADPLLTKKPFSAVRVIPTKYLLNRKHQIVGKPILGIVPEKELRKRIEALLKTEN